MRRGRPPKILNQATETALSKYDSVSLLAALNQLETSLGWQVFKEFAYYQAAAHGTMSNVLVQQTGREREATAAGAKAEVLREVMDKFIDQLRDKVQGMDGSIENPPPEA